MRAPLGARPKFRSVRIDLVRRKIKQQLLDLIDEIVVELQTSPANAIVGRRRTFVDHRRLHRRQHFDLLAGMKFLQTLVEAPNVTEKDPLI